MCTLAGFIGSRPAAPVLIEMMRRQEGLDGGFFTGITTWHEGRFYTAKVQGDVRRLLETTDALRFPGNAGILHSRTPGMGGAERGHPFLSADGRISCVYNGAAGVFKGVPGEAAALLRMRKEGVRFSSAGAHDGPEVPVGTEPGTVHASDLRTQLARSLMASDGLTLAAALEKTMIRYPAEIVALAMDREDPGAISFVRGNAPMNLARCWGEAYLATSALAFPDEVKEAVSLPPESSGRITQNGLSLHAFSLPLPVKRIDPRERPACERALENALRKAGSLDFAHFEKALLPLLPADRPAQSARIAYEILRDWVLTGKAKIVPGVKTAVYGNEADGIEVSHFALSLAD